MLDRLRIRGQEIIEDTISYLVDTYNQSRKIFSYSTSYGQILLVVQNIYKMMLYYLQDVASEKNLDQATREHNIYGMARLTGHNPARNRSARGELALSWKQSANKALIGGGVVYLTNYMSTTCKENGLDYLLDLSADIATIPIGDNSRKVFRIIQGKMEFQRFTGSGEDLQSFNVSVPANSSIEDEKVIVTVNGQQYSTYSSLYDIPFGGAGCVVKTGINGGVDVYFGNSINARVPLLGESIQVDYIISNGKSGNMLDSDFATFEFNDEGIDGLGDYVNINEMFDIRLSMPPVLGANSEAPKLTKVLAPMYNKSSIMHDANSIRYSLMRTGLFSSINVSSSVDGNINMFEVVGMPNIKNRVASEDYFSMDISKFSLKPTEITRLLNFIEESGNKSSNIDIRITNPKLSRYILFIEMDVYKVYEGKLLQVDVLLDAIKTTISSYMMEHDRPNKLPLSDLIKAIDSISQVDSVRITPVSELNELAYLSAVSSGTAHRVVGFNSLGDPTCDRNQIVVLRGGFSDRNGAYYDDTINFNGIGNGILNVTINEI